MAPVAAGGKRQVTCSCVNGRVGFCDAVRDCAGGVVCEAFLWVTTGLRMGSLGLCDSAFSLTVSV